MYMRYNAENQKHVLLLKLRESVKCEYTMHIKIRVPTN